MTHSTERKALNAAIKMGLSDAEARLCVEHVGMTYQLDAGKAERILVARTSETKRTIEAPHADATKVETDEDLDFIQFYGYSHCPHCGIHLSNGVTDFDGVVDAQGTVAKAAKIMRHEYCCLGCNGEWGPVAMRGSGGRKAPTGRIYTNKSDADLKEQGGAVKVCWDLFIANPDMKRKDAIQAAVDKGVAFYTARTQYQKWFKAHNAGKAGRS
jgi:hypothetical protein